MLVLGFLVLPLLALAGYVYRVCRSAVYAEERVVPSKGFLGLVYDGFRFLLVVAIYHLLLSAAVVVVLDAGVLHGESLGPPEPHEVSESTALALSAVFGLWLYGFAAVVTSFAATGSVVRTYVSLRPVRFVFSIRYLKAWLLQLPLLALLYLVGVVMAVTVVGVLFWIPLVHLVLASYWGRVYYDGVNAGKLPPPAI